MNVLRLHTKATSDANVFQVSWFTGLVRNGRILVEMPSMEDANIAAELSVARMLLEDENVCGHEKTGAGLILVLSFGAPKKLMREDSDKPHLAPYALFLRTRFYGLGLEVDKRAEEWLQYCADKVETPYKVAGPVAELIQLGDFGIVEVTAHAVGRYCERTGRQPLQAWRDIVKLAKVTKMVTIPGRNEVRGQGHRNPGEYAYHQGKDLIFVVVPPNRSGGKKRISTIHSRGVNQEVVEVSCIVA